MGNQLEMIMNNNINTLAYNLRCVVDYMERLRDIDECEELVIPTDAPLWDNIEKMLEWLEGINISLCPNCKNKILIIDNSVICSCNWIDKYNSN
jgi:CBS domain-containing protein